MNPITSIQGFLIKKKLEGALPKNPTGEVKMWFAVLEHAINDLSSKFSQKELDDTRKEIKAETDPKRLITLRSRVSYLSRLYVDMRGAFLFFEGETGEFERVCQLAMLNADYVRRVIKQASATDSKELEKAFKKYKAAGLGI